jgi:hypothetical protein
MQLRKADVQRSETESLEFVFNYELVQLVGMTADHYSKEQYFK